MAYAVAAAVLYIITITFLPQKGQDVPTLIVNLSRKLTNTNGVTFVYIFKITGEPTVVAVVEVSKVSALERLLGSLYGFGAFSIESQPVITYQDFAKSLGVAEELTRHPGRILEKDGLFLMEYTVDHHGNSTNELLAAWKLCTEQTLSQLKRGEIRIEQYKYVAERKESVFLNTNSTLEFDRQVFSFPLTQAFGSNTHSTLKGLQFLDDYIKGVTEADVY